VHANILVILPRLKFYAPENDHQFTQIKTDLFYDAYILEEADNGYWHVLVIVDHKIIRVKRFPSAQFLRQEQSQNDRLKRQGNSLIQIVSLNSLKELKTVELYEETTLELDFEDGREIIEIED
jgi:hypothetical protein